MLLERIGITVSVYQNTPAEPCWPAQGYGGYGDTCNNPLIAELNLLESRSQFTKISERSVIDGTMHRWRPIAGPGRCRRLERGSSFRSPLCR